MKHPIEELPKVYVVHLRRPKRAPDEMRSDPFWEFGSFGRTGCHRRNLLHPKHANVLKGSRLAFAQGGKQGFKLVFLTPPITVKRWKDRCEAQWKRGNMPFTYEAAPVLVANDEKTQFKLIEALASRTLRGTLEAGFSSRFRTRTHPLSKEQAMELIEEYERCEKCADDKDFCKLYDQALPRPLLNPDRLRSETYKRLARKLEEGCRPESRC